MNEHLAQTSRRRTFAIISHPDAGKTTITNLILKFYQPTRGSIILNGKNYNDLKHEEIRSNISLV